MYSKYDLCIQYLQKFYNKNNITNVIKKESLVQISFLLAKGFTDKDIIIAINNDVKDLYTFFNDKTPTNYNLLHPLKFYYHKELRIISPPPVIDFDYDTGERTVTYSDYFLEMKSSYTLEDLYNYISSFDDLYNKNIYDKNKVIGTLKWLYEKYDIELLLYMIDASNDYISTNGLQPLTNLFDIQTYYNYAKEKLDAKINQSKITEGEQIVPKRRVLFD